MPFGGGRDSGELLKVEGDVAAAEVGEDAVEAAGSFADEGGRGDADAGVCAVEDAAGDAGATEAGGAGHGTEFEVVVPGGEEGVGEVLAEAGFGAFDADLQEGELVFVFAGLP